MKKKIYRSRKDRMIGGVCGGIAEYFEIDSTLVRLAFLVILLARGAGLLAYIIAWIIIPEKPGSFYDENGKEVDVVDIKKEEDDKKKEGNNSEDEKKTSDKQRLFGIILVILGAVFLFEVWIPHFYWQQLWPLIIIGLGIGIIIKGAYRHE